MPRKLVDLVCNYCNKPFQGAIRNDRDRRFCSRTCTDLARVICTSPTCGHPTRKHFSKHMCKPCYEKAYISRPGRRKKRRDRDHAYYLKHPDRCKNISLKSNYGITLDYYNLLLVEQNYRCGICRRLPTEVKGTRNILEVDHDHSCCSKSNGRLCGKCVRGLLCKPCNSSLLPGYELLPIEMQTINTINNYLSRVGQRTV